MPESRIDYILNAAQATTEATKLEASFAGVGKAAQSAGVQGAAGMTQAEVATRSVGLRQLELQANLKRVNVEIAGYAASLQELNAITPKTAGAQAQLTREIQQETAALEELILIQAQYKAQLAELNVTAGLSTRQIVQVGAAVDRLAGVAIPGARSIGLLAGSFSAAAIPQLALIIGVSLLIGELLKLLRAKEDVIKVDKDQLDLDLRRVDVTTRNLRVTGDLVAGLRLIASQTSEYAKNTTQLNRDLTDLEATGHRNTSFLTLLTSGLYNTGKSSQDLQKDIAHTSTELAAQDEKMKAAVVMFQAYQAEQNRSTADVIEFAKQQHFSGEELEFVRERLDKEIDSLRRLGEEIEKLKVPKFDVSATPQGISALSESILSGLASTFEKGIGGSATATNNFAAQVRALAPTLEALDNALKHNAGSQAEYRREIEALNPAVRTALQLHKQQVEQYNEEFKAKQKIKDIGPALELEFLKASIALAKDDFDLKRQLVVKEFAFRREEMIKHEQATQANLNRLKAIEVLALTEVTNAYVAHYVKLNEERNKDLTRQREFRVKELAEWYAHFVKQRQIREDEEKKFFAEQAKLEFKARSDRAGRRETEADVKSAQVEELRRVREAFGQTSVAARTFDEMIKKIAEDGKAGFSVVSTSIAGLASELFSVANIANAVGNMIGNAFEAAISGADSFGHSLTKAILGFIAGIAQQFGALFILIGSGLIWLGYPGGGALIGYGIALEALAGVLRGFAAKIGQTGPTASTGGAATTSGATAAAPRAAVPPNVIPFPTSGASSHTTIVQLDQSGTKTFLEGQRVVFLSDFQGGKNSPAIAKRIKKMAS